MLDPTFPSIIINPHYERYMWLYGRTGGFSVPKVSFFNGADLFTLNGTVSTKDPFASDLISVHTDKDLENPAGTFTITTHNRRIRNAGAYQGLTVYEAINVGDVCVISFRRVDPAGPRIRDQAGRALEGNTPDWDTGYTCVMVGEVGQKPRFSAHLDGEGAVEHRVTITGCDLGKKLVNAQIYWFKDVPSADIKQFALQGRDFLVTGDGKKGPFPGGARRELFKSVLDHVFYPMTSINMKRAEDPTKREDLGDLLGYKLGKTTVMANGEEAKMPSGIDFYSQEETVWAFLEGMAEKPFCELFVDTWPTEDTFITDMMGSSPTADFEKEPHFTFDGGQTYLCMRQPPFDKADWKKLPLFVVDQAVIQGYDVGGEPTIYNLFYGYPADYAGLASTPSMLMQGVPIFDKVSFKRFGLRSMIVASKVFPYFNDGTSEGTIKAVGHKLTNSLYDWFQPSDKFLSGTLTVQGHPAYRVGTRLRVNGTASGADDKSLAAGVDLSAEYYLEGVAHEWTAFQGYETTLRVTRGLPLVAGEPDEKTRFPPPYVVAVGDAPVNASNLIA
jgi:hypothetical protein